MGRSSRSMKKKIVFVERKQSEYVSLEKAFRETAALLSCDFKIEFQQTPFGVRFFDTIRNLMLFRKRPADLYQITGHIHYIALLLPRANTVLSIMDLRILSVPGRIRRYFLKKLYLDFPVNRMRYITAISEHTRREIIENTGCDERKVRVIGLPLLRYLSEPVKREFNKDFPRILQVGTMPNKNIPNLVRALTGIPCELRIIGKVSLDQSEILKASGVKYTNAFDLSDEEMRREYLDADIVSFCSTYEGFGMPIIEGQAMGKPVITSDLSPMRETSGGLACLVDPHNPDSIREGILSLINDEPFRQKLASAGRKNAERFTPDKVAKQYEQLYHEILSGAEVGPSL